MKPKVVILALAILAAAICVCLALSVVAGAAAYVVQKKETAEITSEQIREVTADMKYGDVTTLDTPCGYSGEELLAALTDKQ